MSELLVLTTLLFAADETATVAAHEVTVEAVYASAYKGLDYLKVEGKAWAEKRKCASCHHVPFTIWTMEEAKRRGHTIDEAVLAELIEFNLSEDDKARITQKPPPPKEGEAPRLDVSMGAIYTLLAFSEVSDVSETAQKRRDAVFAYLAESQQPDGNWVYGLNRPPVNASETDLKLLTFLMLDRSAKSQTNPQIKTLLDKALPHEATLEADDNSQQYHSLRLLLDMQLGKDAEMIQPRIDLLLSRQHEDGGWSQTVEMNSDPYQTGQTLYALAVAGVPSDHPAVKAAWGYLLKTQKSEGFWPMTSRPMKPGEEGAKNLEPITYAGTGWAVLGLLRSSPEIGK
ncbi:MAG: terpene cyclase/mutase family protein [Planctomycetota bacterium]|nr:terpene cyclase/mutase family protein [Planctomycetota bacterium]MDA1212854.1 terpene cyclase/mutase family protein [Planctomycetota bacterium]